MTLILGRKRGMTQLFAEDGTVTGVTVVEAGPCVVTQVRTEEKDNYSAIQIGFEDVRDSLVTKPQRGHFKAGGVATKRFLREERLAKPAEQSVGDVIACDAFGVGDLVDVIGTTKGRGFAGTIKRHGFSRGSETHGCMNVRQPGSIGCSAYPSRVMKGKRSSGHYGAKRHTTKNLEVMQVDTARNLLFIKGAIPGPPNGFVQVRTARTGIKKGLSQMKVKSYKSGSVGQVEFDEKSFGEKVLYRTLKDAVVMFQANQRQGTVKTKTRGEVTGTGKKPYKQKHTGRARAGDVKSPIWRGGGTVFGPRPRDYSYHMPVKARRVALRSALAGKLADGEVVVVELGEFSAPSAKAARKVLADLGSPRRAVLVLNDRNENVWKSFRNFPLVNIRTAAELCAHDVVAGGLIIAEGGALEAVAERVGPKGTKKVAKHHGEQQ